ncbi:MAG TPA: DUF1707 domain-containing protein [Thermoleophilaceae bacterium]|nr:DUF1707 domain-containing protein [Thermoleophilaceae bacterium]
MPTSTFPSTTSESTRAADADRERIVERLHAAAVEGRLNADELEARLEAALSASTYLELDQVVADLPAQTAAMGSARRPPQLGAFAATSILLLAIWALTGMGYFWPVWPILGWGLFVVPGTLTGGRVRACRRSA